MTEKPTQDDLRQLVQREVLYCVSQLVHDLTGQGGAEQESDEAIDLWTAIVGPDAWIEAAEQHGAEFEQCEDEDHPDHAAWTVKGSECDWHETKAEAAQEYCERHNLEDNARECAGEVYEHWLVTRWFAEKLEAEGERIVRDWHGLTIWARCTTGQAIYMDGVIARIWQASGFAEQAKNRRTALDRLTAWAEDAERRLRTCAPDEEPPHRNAARNYRELIRLLS